jgi:hypothetical protein
MRLLSIVILSEDFAPACRGKTTVEGPRVFLYLKLAHLGILTE